MFCEKCGSKIPEGSSSCLICDAPVKSAFVTEENAQKPYFKAPVEQPPVAQPTYNQPPMVQQPMYNQYPQNNGMGYNPPDYTVLGGFLKFLVIMFKYISPIILILQAVINTVTSISTIVSLNKFYSYFGYSDGVIARFVIILIISDITDLGGMVILHILGRKIENKDPDFLKLLQIIYFVTTALLLLSVIVSIGSATIPSLLGRMIGYLFIQVVGFVLWNLYFVKSQRVRQYMGSDEYMHRCIIDTGKLFGVTNNRPMY